MSFRALVTIYSQAGLSITIEDREAGVWVAKEEEAKRSGGLTIARADQFSGKIVRGGRSIYPSAYRIRSSLYRVLTDDLVHTY